MVKIDLRHRKDNPRYGMHHSEETRKKISITGKGQIRSLETRKKMSRILCGKNNPMWGKHHSKETRKKMSKIHIGKHHSKETRKKISLSNIGKNKGKKHSLQTRMKMSKMRKGKNSPMYGKHLSLITKHKISKTKKGKNYGMVGKNSYWYGKHHSKKSNKKNSLSHMGKNNHFYNKRHSIMTKILISKANKGKLALNKNPTWNNGSSKEPYNILFNNEFKELVRKRDGTECLYCNEKNGNTAHHINYMKFHTNLKNCVWVCHNCNLRFNVDRDFFFEYWCKRLKINPWDNIQEAEKYRKLKVVHMIKMIKEKKY